VKSERILIIDDEPSIRFGIREYLEMDGYGVSEAESVSEAMECFQGARHDLVILDYALPDGSGVDLTAALLALDPDLPILVLTAHGSIELAVSAMRAGAVNFLTKPVELPALLLAMQRALEHRRTKLLQLAGKTQSARRWINPFLGRSLAMRELAEQAKRVACAQCPTLILGETGVGKGVLARWLHDNGPDASAPFVDLNCAGLSRDLLESELFGHARGAFTGAVVNKRGLLDIAHGGTVFLDELGDMDTSVQPKLLKVLEEKRFRSLGEVRDREVSIRLIGATHRDLLSLVEQEKFRSDLYFRISTIPLMVPSLRQRTEDIAPLATSILHGFALDSGREIAFAPSAIEALQAYAWPGNVRELRNVIERAVLLCDGRTIEVRYLHLAGEHTSTRMRAMRKLTLAEVERVQIEQTMNDTGGRVDEAARILGVSRSSLYEKLKKYGIPPSK
jgi:DNA-binding NtrC family response regulator